MKTSEAPSNIEPAKGLNIGLGLALLGAGLFTGAPVIFAIYYDGLARVLDWPPLFNWLSAFTVFFGFCAVRLLSRPHRTGANVAFKPDGFILQIRLLARKEQTFDLSWSNIDTVEFVDGARNTSGLTFRTQDNVVASFPLHLLGIRPREAFERFRAAAEHAGYAFEKGSSLNALVISRQTWDVVSAKNR